VSRTGEDINPHDVPLPATTDPARLLEQMAPAKGAEGLTVVFSAYKSLPVIHQAQQQALDDFDLVMRRSAPHHRRDLDGEDPPNFVRVHEPAYSRSARRLYMTATPPLFDQDGGGEHWSP
jgi:predicted helicase